MPSRRPPRRQAGGSAGSSRAPILGLGLALAALTLYVWWAWWPATEAPLPPLDPTRDTVVFLGDSITSGHGLPLAVTFPLRLGATLGINVRNAGVSGDTSAGVLRRLETDVLSYRPKLVVVEVGANDVFRRVPRAQIFANVRAIVRRLRGDGTGVVLVHIRLGVFGGDALGDGFRTIAREEGARLVEDFLDGVAPNLTTDGLHPTAEGHARLAERLEPILRDLLSR